MIKFNNKNPAISKPKYHSIAAANERHVTKIGREPKHFMASICNPLHIGNTPFKHSTGSKLLILEFFIHRFNVQVENTAIRFNVLPTMTILERNPGNSIGHFKSGS